MDIFEVFRRRRSIRRFRRIEVEEEKIEKILESAFYSPSSHNNRPWHFIVVKDSSLLKKLARVKESGAEMLEEATLGIVICADEQRSTAWIEDASIAAEHIQLASTALGLGACWVQIRGRMHNEKMTAEVYVKRLLKIPEHIRVLSIIALGYPAESKSPHNKKEIMRDRIHWNVY